MVDADYLRQIAPELGDVSTERLDFFVDIAKLRNDQTVWGQKYDYAVALDACHELTLASRGGYSGPITQAKVGEISAGYGTFQGGQFQNPYETTSYGIMYLNLRKTILITPIIV